MNIISLHNGHDASITAFDGQEILGHWELERVLNIKHFCGVDRGNEIANVLYDHVLPKLGWKVSDIEQVVFAGKSEWTKTEFNTFVPQYDNSNMRKPYATGSVELRDLHIVPCVSVLHHVNHMAYAYFTSPFTSAIAYSYDGVGDGTSSMAGYGLKNKLYAEMNFGLDEDYQHWNQGIGLCYSYLGRLFPFLGSDLLATAGKAMGLSSYGVPYGKDTLVYKSCSKMLAEWMPEPSKYKKELEEQLPGIDWNNPMDIQVQNLMATIQECLEVSLCNVIDYVQCFYAGHMLVDIENLVMAGGCALNVQANTRLLKDGVVEKLYVPPATSDCGVSIGAGLYVWHSLLDNPFNGVEWHSPYLGDEVYGAPPSPSWDNYHTDEFLSMMVDKYPTITSCYLPDGTDLIDETAKLLSEGQIIAWAQGRCEIGPRALGNRSIICSTGPTQENWAEVWREGKGTFKETINEAIKHREFWRPFAPIGLVEDAFEYFDIDHEQPYMLEAPLVRDWGKSEIKVDRVETVAATVHVDGTARIQTVSEQNNKLMFNLLTAYKERTGVGILLNTSLNDAGIPINNRLEDILNLLRDTKVDYAVVDNWIFWKRL